jgi:hypothetical protein
LKTTYWDFVIFNIFFEPFVIENLQIIFSIIYKILISLFGRKKLPLKEWLLMNSLTANETLLNGFSTYKSISSIYKPYA